MICSHLLPLVLLVRVRGGGPRSWVYTSAPRPLIAASASSSPSQHPGQAAGTCHPAPNGALGWTQCSHPPAFKLPTAVAFLSLLHRCPSLCLALCMNHVTSFSQQSFPSQIFILHFLCAKGIQSKECSNE